ncbi:MAG: immunoglobulin domain-containing protein, partial [Lacunisphaera sp.]
MLHRSIRIPSVILFFFGIFQLFGLSARATVSTLAVGQAYSLSVTADGSAPFSYQWYHDGVAMSGVTGAVYSSTAKVSDAGAYSATVSNAAGSATSDTVTVTIVALPVLTTQPVSQTVTAGSSVTFTAAASGTPAPTYQWSKNSVNLPGATSASYSIAATATLDAGSYTVVATNTAGSVTSATASLTVNVANVAPAIVVQPASQTVTAGGNVSFTATASGTPVPTYQWTLNGAAIAGATSPTLSLTKVQVSSAGNYTVVATNSAGAVTSNAAILTVNPLAVAPVITTQPGNQTVSAGAAVTLTASASGTPAPSYQWLKNGATISGATGASYTIGSATSASAGTYSVVASNSAGSVTSSGAVLTVNVATSVPVITSQPASQAVQKGG